MTVSLSSSDIHAYRKTCAPISESMGQYPQPNDDICFPMILQLDDKWYYGNHKDDDEYKKGKVGRVLKIHDVFGNKYVCVCPSVWQTKDNKEFLKIIEPGDCFYVRMTVSTHASQQDHGELYINIHEIRVNPDSSWDIYTNWKHNGPLLKKKIQMTEEQIDHIRALADNGKTDKQIAEETGHSVSTVARYANSETIIEEKKNESPVKETLQIDWIKESEKFIIEKKKTTAEDIRDYLNNTLNISYFIGAKKIHDYFKSLNDERFYCRRNGALKKSLLIDYKEPAPVITHVPMELPPQEPKKDMNLLKNVIKIIFSSSQLTDTEKEELIKDLVM